MMTGNDVHRHDRILAVDTRPHWLGFAVLIPPAQLLDFGLLRFTVPTRREVRVVRLIKTFRPGLVLIGVGRGHHGTLAFQKLILDQSLRLSIPVMRVSVGAVRQYFRGSGAHNKEEAARLVARQFPELSWRVPPPRKRWHHEHQNMPIFDAVIIGLAYLQRDDGSRW